MPNNTAPGRCAQGLLGGFNATLGFHPILYRRAFHGRLGLSNLGMGMIGLRRDVMRDSGARRQAGFGDGEEGSPGEADPHFHPGWRGEGKRGGYGGWRKAEYGERPPPASSSSYSPPVHFLLSNVACTAPAAAQAENEKADGHCNTHDHSDDDGERLGRLWCRDETDWAPRHPHGCCFCYKFRTRGK